MFRFTDNLNENVRRMNALFENDSTYICRIAENGHGLRCALFFLDGMVESSSINDNILFPITRSQCGTIPLEELVHRILQIDDIKLDADTDQAFSAMLYGDTILLMDGDSRPLVLNTKGFSRRSPEEPDNEKVIRGPREGFIEAFMTNLSLIRRRLRNPNLKFSFQKLGTVTRTTVCLCYIDGLADQRVLEEVKLRLSKIDLDSILDSNYLTEFIRDNPRSPFPTVGVTERPDIAAAKLLEGRIAIVVDGTPAVLTVPHILQESFQTNDDYYVSYLYSNANRFLRILGFLLTISIPAVYCAMLLWHQELIPTRLFFSVCAARAGVPFPTLIEAVLLLIVFEILKESGTRTPGPIGQALSIVGGLVLGQAAVEARFVSAPMVIVIAFAGITGLVVPKLKTAALLLRFFLLGCAAVLGLYGYLFGLSLVLCWLCAMQSFGIPYLTNLLPSDRTGGRDIAVRFPWYAMKRSHRFLADPFYYDSGEDEP